jgi:hypothetical protein
MRFINYVARSFVTTTMIAGAALMGVMVGYAIASYEAERANKNED